MNGEQAERFQQLLEEACDHHIDGGGKVITRFFKDSEGGRCPLACLFGLMDIRSIMNELKQMLGVTVSYEEMRNQKETPHLNLYHFTERGGYLLMTRDHILPVAWNGDDSVENLQTMCAQCNQAKGTLTPLHFVCKMTQWPTYRQMIELESRLINAPQT